jgi:hypothetical protein
MTGDDLRCSDASRAAGEQLSATATSVQRWVLVEVPGAWPRDVADAGPLPAPAREALAGWLAGTPRSRLLFLRRPGRPTDRPAVFAVRTEEATAEVRRIDIADHAELAQLDLDRAGEPFGANLILVCGHGSRDQCCALRGTAVFAALAGQLGGVDELWLSSHHGGHRFAANAFVLPFGLHFGRLDVETAPAVIARALEGRIDLDRYRGRTFYEPPVQAAEHALRRELGLEGLDDLGLAGVEDGVVRFRTADGTVHAAVVEERPGPAVPASCGAPAEPQPEFSARLV